MENKCVPFLLLLVALVLPSAAAGDGRVEDVDRLLDAGARGLALRFIDEQQPDYGASPVRWQRWERRRLSILAARADWQAIIDRVAGYPSDLPDDFWILARESMARAHLARGDGGSARALVAGLIWSTAQDTAFAAERTARLERWRTMLAESYLLAGGLADAETTRLRHRLDYHDNPRGWRLAEARALIRARRDAEARERLAGIDTTEVTYLKLVLEARNASVDPVAVLADMAPLLGEGRLLPAERSELWAALAGAAARYRDHEVRVTALEQALALRPSRGSSDGFTRIDGDRLWEAYEAHAETLANQAHLLVGRFDAWLALARQFDGAGDVRARALYAYLASQDRDAQVADAARAGLAAALAGEPRGLRIHGALYLDSRRYPEIASIPPEPRAALVAYALDESRPAEAGALVSGLDAQARRALAPEWRAPVAVALVGEGRIEAALALFGEDFYAAPHPKGQVIDASVRVALALHHAGAHEHAADLLSRALLLSEDADERRALLLLAAESEDRAGRHERAARLYIESAQVPEGGPSDAWSRAARVQAARALAQAGLADDAAGVLETTLADSPRADSPRADTQGYLEELLRRF